MKLITRFPLALGVCIASTAIPLLAQQAAQGNPVSVTVTLEPRRGAMAQVTATDLTVTEAGEKRPVTGFTPLGDQAKTQILLLIDNSAGTSFNSQIPTLKSFVNSLPPSFDVGIAYMQNGMAAYARQFTSDHGDAANSIRVAMGPGGADVDPYGSLADAIKRWPDAGAQRKQVVMISSGIEGLGGGFISDNPYVMSGINAALKAGVTVYTIYSPSVGHFGHDYWRMTWGQNFLGELADQTGGENYWIGFGPPVSFQPFLNSILALQKSQFLLTFDARPEKKSGLQPLKVTVNHKDASIAYPAKVWVKATA